MASTALSMRQAVVGATIAADALELLGKRTPTLAIEALKLKHQFEVMAECQFSGVEYHMPLRLRLHEIERETKEICNWFGDGRQRQPALNAQMAIYTALVREYKRFGQFDEEQECMHQIRRCHVELWKMQRFYRAAAALPLGYVVWLLKSFSRFTGAVIAWLVLFCVTLTYLSSASWHCAAQGALITFFTAGRPEGFVGGCERVQALQSAELYFGFAVSFAIVVAYVHLAVLVAHLYASINRR